MLTLIRMGPYLPLKFVGLSAHEFTVVVKNYVWKEDVATHIVRPRRERDKKR